MADQPSKQVAASHPPFSQLLDEVSAFIYTTDINGKYTYANKLVCDLLGQPLSNMIGKDFTDFVDLGDAEGPLRETDRQVLEQGLTIEREESNYIHATGETRIYWSTKKPIRNEQGHIIGLIGISHDITEQKRLENQVRQQKELFDAILCNVNALIFMKDENSRFIYANPQMAKAYGTSVDNIIGHQDIDFIPEDIAKRFRELDLQAIESGKSLVDQASLTDSNGNQSHYWTVLVPWKTPDNTNAIVGISTDITELQNLKDKLASQAKTDELTGISNRRGFYERAAHEFSRSRRYNTPLSYIAIDLDHFKTINDSYGHIVGDHVLIGFAGACQRSLRQEDFFVRTGGEEFGILLPNTKQDKAFDVAERIRQTISTLIPVADLAELRITASFGVATLNEQDTSFENLFSRADQALYLAKKTGRNRVFIFNQAG